MRNSRVIIVGAGIGGLVAALELARRGLQVTVCERAARPGGKMRALYPGGSATDSGPTVFTMRWVFERIFDDAGVSLSNRVKLVPLDCLARHAWSDRDRLDLFADIGRSADAIGAFAGAGEANGYRAFMTRAKATYDTLEGPFMRSSQPTPVSLALSAGLGGLGDMLRISPFTTLWRALGDHFRDPRLRQLFGRYATYCGSSPFQAPATLMLVAHVEAQGVWVVEGGMHHFAGVLASLAAEKGARFRYECDVSAIDTTRSGVAGVTLSSGERIEGDAVVVNADSAAVATGLLGASIAPAVPSLPRASRSLSAVTWSVKSEARGFPLQHHNVFFSRDYQAEFADILDQGFLPREPTVYVCAQDRLESQVSDSSGPERMLLLVNAPPTGDRHRFEPAEIERCQERIQSVLARCGLAIDLAPDKSIVTTPAGFDRLFPATGGALYGQASHGWATSFSRPEARTAIPGLYLAGGSVHPGPGVPMAALSGWLAAASLVSDLTSPGRSHRVVMPGGMSTR
ncbi:MAG: 1-hydroxycarotenoid 3,4-desaturase CrtD [Hyphomicrobium sp.]